MAKIDRVRLEMAVLAPTVTRTDANQSLEAQETRLVTVVDSDGAEGTGCFWFSALSRVMPEITYVVWTGFPGQEPKASRMPASNCPVSWTRNVCAGGACVDTAGCSRT